MTTPYRFYQYWMNVDDRNAPDYLRMFTLMERGEIEALDAALAERPESREAQGALAMDVTARVHGAEAAHAAREASRVVFDRRADPRELGSPVLEMLHAELPRAVVTLVEGAVSVVDLLVDSGLVKSKGEARRQLQQGAVTVNGRRLGAEETSVAAADALAGRFFLIRKGGRDIAIGSVA
jgi:tyrosyl-tRNA synthetase